MARNVEIKARINSDCFDLLRANAQSLATDGPIQLKQTDTFFETPRGRLKTREFGDGTAELIFYERPNRDGPKTSHYIRSDCAPSVKQALAGAYGITGVVKKQREVFFVGVTRVHLDRVEGLGTFLELEVVLDESGDELEGERIANQLLEQLQVPPTALVSGAYIDLLAIG